MLYIPKIDDCLEVVTDKEVKDFVKSLYIFLTTSDEVEKYVQSNSSDNDMYH